MFLEGSNDYVKRKFLNIIQPRRVAKTGLPELWSNQRLCPEWDIGMLQYRKYGFELSTFPIGSLIRS
jgi:hypothetical protein